jgi:hypothetical protein
MNNVFRNRAVCLYLVVALLVAGNTACEKEGFDYDGQTGNEPSNYTLTDTLSVDMKTVLLDSMITSDHSVLLCGEHRDPYFGRISAHTYFQLQLPVNKTLEDRAIYDSLELRLPANGHVHGDTTLMQHIGVYRVEQDIKLPLNTYNFYNHTTFRTGSEALGRLDKVLYPYQDTIVPIRLSDVLGNELFNHLKNRTNEVSAQDQFIDYFKGLSLKPTGGSAAINDFRIGDSLVMRLHYHLSAMETEQKYVDFTVYNPELQFNHIETDRSGTLLSALSDNNKTLGSAQTENMTFTQPLSQVVTRIDLPTLRNLPQLGKFFKIMRATLTVRPVSGTYVTPYPLPERLTVCAANNLNQITDTLVAPATGGVQYGDLVIDKLYGINTAYTYDITTYCIAQMTSNDYTSRGLLLIPSSGDYYTRFNRVLTGDKQNKKNRISIEIYYMAYNSSQQ